MPDTIRAFLAVEIDDTVREEVRTVQGQFRQAKPQAKWTEPELCHLTLKFLGMVDQQQLNSVSDICRRVAGQHLPFYLRFQGLGVFPNIRNVRVVWMGISEGERELSALAQDLESELEVAGFEAEDRPFQPHLTLGRLKEPLNRAQMLYFNQMLDGYAHFAFGLVPVTAFHLVRSVLQATGPMYSLLESYPLGTLALEAPGDEAPADEAPLEERAPDDLVTLEDEFSGVDTPPS